MGIQYTSITGYPGPIAHLLPCDVALGRPIDMAVQAPLITGVGEIGLELSQSCCGRLQGRRQIVQQG